MREITHICELCDITLDVDTAELNISGEVICKDCGSVSTEVSKKNSKIKAVSEI